MKDWKDFVYKLCELGSTNTSKEIANIINDFDGLQIKPGQVAAVKASWTRKNK